VSAGSTIVPLVGEGYELWVEAGMDEVVESSGLTIVLGRAVGLPVGATIVLFGGGYGKGSSDPSGLAIELEDAGRAVGPPVGAISVLLPAG
jgi:hypothetical protein